MCYQSYNRLCCTGLEHSKSQRILKSFHWFKRYSDLAEWVDFVYWRICIGKGPHEACKAGFFLSNIITSIKFRKSFFQKQQNKKSWCLDMSQALSNFSNYIFDEYIKVLCNSKVQPRVYFILQSTVIK